MKEFPIEVQPHMTKAEGQLKHTDIAVTSLYNATVSIVNSERQTIWQRYNALLLANTVVFGFINRSELSSAHVVIACVVGLFLCFFWWTLTKDGWRFFEAYCQMAKRFRFPAVDDEVNANVAMFEEFKNWESKSPLMGRFNGGDTIKTAALGVILLFAVGYIFILSIRVGSDMVALWSASSTSVLDSPGPPYP